MGAVLWSYVWILYVVGRACYALGSCAILVGGRSCAVSVSWRGMLVRISAAVLC